MANATVTITTTHIEVTFNDLFTDYNSLIPKVGRYNKSKIISVENKGEYVRVSTDNSTWDVSHNGQKNSIIIDNVDGVTPTTVDNLYTLLKIMLP